MATHHRHAVLESIPRNEAEERPELGDLGDRDASIHWKWIVGELALANIGFVRAGPVICRGAEESPALTLPFTAPKQFSLPSTVPSTSSSEISGVWPIKLLGKLPQWVQTHLSVSRP
jgi:hypothetical protein